MNSYPDTACIPSVLPDKDEKKAIRRYYFRISWIIIAFLLFFSEFSTLMISIAAGIIGGGFSEEQIEAGKNIISSVPAMKALFSYGFPIAADIIAIAVGLSLTKCNLWEKIRFSGFTGTDFLKTAALSFGTSTIASFINLFIIVIIMLIMYGFSDYDLSETLNATSIVSTGNPFWLDILIYFYICLLGPVLEELIFRGVLLDALRKYGNAFGIIMSSVLFGLMHQNITQCIPAAVIGIFCAAITLKSNSLIPAIVIHITNNTFAALIMVLMPSDLMSDMMSLSSMTVPFIVTVLLNSLFRLTCIIASIVIIIKYFSKKRKFVRSDSYTSSRTWKYFFTSIPWLLAIGYMIYGTVTSVTL